MRTTAERRRMAASTIRVHASLPRVTVKRGTVGHILVSPAHISDLFEGHDADLGVVACHANDSLTLSSSIGGMQHGRRHETGGGWWQWATANTPTCKNCIRAIERTVRGRVYS